MSLVYPKQNLLTLLSASLAFYLLQLANDVFSKFPTLSFFLSFIFYFLIAATAIQFLVLTMTFAATNCPNRDYSKLIWTFGLFRHSFFNQSVYSD